MTFDFSLAAQASVAKMPEGKGETSPAVRKYKDAVYALIPELVGVRKKVIRDALGINGHEVDVCLNRLAEERLIRPTAPPKPGQISLWVRC